MTPDANENRHGSASQTEIGSTIRSGTVRQYKLRRSGVLHCTLRRYLLRSSVFPRTEYAYNIQIRRALLSRRRANSGTKEGRPVQPGVLKMGIRRGTDFSVDPIIPKIPFHRRHVGAPNYSVSVFDAVRRRRRKSSRRCFIAVSTPRSTGS